MSDLIQLISIVLNVVMFIYIIYTIPKRVKTNGKKLKTINDNQKIILTAIKNK